MLKYIWFAYYLSCNFNKINLFLIFLLSHRIYLTEAYPLVEKFNTGDNIFPSAADALNRS